MAQYFTETLCGQAIRIEVAEMSGFHPTRFRAQVSCPFGDCDAFYNCQNKYSQGAAKTVVKNSLRTHFNKKHGLS